MFAGSLRWRPQEKHKREWWEGDTVRPWACDAGCSIMLITCLSRISFLRILSRCRICLPLPPCLDPGSSTNHHLVQLRVGRPSAHHRRPLTPPRRHWLLSIDFAAKIISKLDYSIIPRKHVGGIPFFSPLACCVIPCSGVVAGG